MDLRSSFARMAALLWMVASMAGCGGSDDPAAPSALQAAQSLASTVGREAEPTDMDVAQLGARRRALAQLTSDQPSAEVIALFDFGEATFKQFFPSHQVNRVIGSLAYRFYPETGAYLVVDTDLRIYVVGGPFGPDLTFVGVVGDYVKPANGFLLRVARAGTGTGTIASSTGGIACGATCSASFSAGTSVTLTATAAAGSTFTGWTGACSGSAATCQVAMDAAKDVTATFASSRYTLSVVVDGTGTGVVVSSTGGFSCGGACSSQYSAGSAVTLLAVPTGNSTFTGWSGACSGAVASCSVSMDAAKSVTATFAAPVSR